MDNEKDVVKKETGLGTIRVADEVVSIIAGLATTEVDGIAGMSCGIAGGIAQSSIPQVTRAGASGIGVGTGYYGGQSAIAVGVSSISDGGNWIMKGSFSINSQGRTGVGAGALYQW